MKNLIFITLLSLAISNSYGAINQAIANGIWSSTPTWSLGHVPVAGENVVIPAGKTVTINNLQNYAGNLTVDIYGILRLNGGSLYLLSLSVISIYTGGELIGMGNNTELVKIGGVVKYDGSNQTPVFGPQMANSMSGAGFQPFITLPVKFASFTVAEQKTGVLIQWATAQEQNSSYFEVEQSEDGSKFISIGRITAAGNTSYLSEYSFNDRISFFGTKFYRVKEVDKNGQTAYTDIKLIRVNSTTNPFVQILASNNTLILKFSQAIIGNVQVRIISFDGKIISQRSINNPLGQIVLSQNASLRGIYIISLSNEKDLNISKQVRF